MNIELPTTLTRFYRYFSAICLVLVPLLTGFLVYSAPEGGGAANIAATSSQLGQAEFELILGVIVSLLFPFSTIALALPALPRSPWLATIGGGIAMIAWIALIPFEILSAMTYEMVRIGTSSAYVSLWDRVNNGVVMSTYTLIFILCHLIGPLLLGIALGRAHIIPRWAVGVFIFFVPVQAARFVLHIPLLALLAYGLLTLGCAAVAWNVLQSAHKSQIQLVPTSTRLIS